MPTRATVLRSSHHVAADSGAAGHRAAPFLKWAGGKRQLLPALRPFYPPAFQSYVEPFAGSAAVFFDLASRGCLDTRPALLSDDNVDLIGCYEAIRADVSGVVRWLKVLEADHAREGALHYYRIRDEEFNPARRRLRADGERNGGQMPSLTRLAAMLIYLNRTGFNGLFRVNRQGDFNVPAGRYARPAICNAPRLRAVAALLQQPGVRLTCEPYHQVLERVPARTFVYLDPPYAPISETARFTSYTAGGFGPDDQVRLRDVTVALAARGCFVLLSNSSTPFVESLFDTVEARLAGMRVHRVPARRAINSRPAARGPVTELVITNIRPSGGAPESASA